jgi:hypothetical protein
MYAHLSNFIGLASLMFVHIEPVRNPSTATCVSYAFLSTDVNSKSYRCLVFMFKFYRNIYSPVIYTKISQKIPNYFFHILVAILQ